MNLRVIIKQSLVKQQVRFDTMLDRAVAFNKRDDVLISRFLTAAF